MFGCQVPKLFLQVLIGLYCYNISAAEPAYEQDSYGYSLPNYDSASSCDLTKLCCGMADMNCCSSRGDNTKCYNVWERKCDGDIEDEKQCRVILHKHCDKIKVRACYLATEISHRDYEVSYCIPKPLRKCFKYQRKICIPKEEAVNRPITWVNEDIIKVNETSKKHCITVDSYDCKTKYGMKNIYERVQTPKVVQETDRRCQMVPIQNPSGTIKVPVTKIVYRKACYKMPINTCSAVSSCGSPCPGGSKQCLPNQYQQNSVCPYNFNSRKNNQGVTINQNCQRIQTPLCGVPCGGQQNNVGNQVGSQLNNQQSCCRQTFKTICQNVPERVTKEVSQPVPGKLEWKEDCQNVVYNKTVFVWNNIVKQVNQSRNDCTPRQKQECHDYHIPTFDIVTKKKTVNVQVRLPVCHHQFVDDEYCHVFPIGDIECRKTSVRKSFKIHKIKCDREVEKPQCVPFPSLQCRTQSSAPKCRLVQRKVCSNEPCDRSKLCMICSKFFENRRFGSCSTSTCGNFIENDLYWNGTMNAGGFDYTSAGFNGGSGEIEPIEGTETFGGITTPGGSGSFGGITNLGGSGSFGGTISPGGSGSFGGINGFGGSESFGTGGSGSFGATSGSGGYGSYGSIRPPGSFSDYPGSHETVAGMDTYEQMQGYPSQYGYFKETRRSYGVDHNPPYDFLRPALSSSSSNSYDPQYGPNSLTVDSNISNFKVQENVYPGNKRSAEDNVEPDKQTETNGEN